jgi:MipA family protein
MRTMPSNLNRMRGLRRAHRTPRFFSALRRPGLVAATALALQAQPVRADQGWHVSSGPALVVEPQYPGSRGELTLPLPMMDVAYGRWLFANSDHGLGAYIVNNDRWQVGSSLWFRRGRYHDENSKIADLSDLNTAAQGRLFASYVLGPIALGTTVARDFGGSSGLTIDSNAAWRLQLNSTAQISVGVQATYGNSRYMQAWFGVTADQARASQLPEYSPGAGLRSVGPTASLSYALSQRWTLMARASNEFLTSKANGSPIVERNSLPTVAVGVVYHFIP